MNSDDSHDDTHAQIGVPPEFIPEGHTVLTEYTEDDLPTLAEDIAADTDAPTDEILGRLRELVEKYHVPLLEAERSVREGKI